MMNLRKEQQDNLWDAVVESAFQGPLSSTCLFCLELGTKRTNALCPLYWGAGWLTDCEWGSSSRRRFRKVLERRVEISPSSRAYARARHHQRVKRPDSHQSAFLGIGRRRRRSIIIVIIVTGTGREWSQARPAQGVLAPAAAAVLDFERHRRK